MLYPDIKVTPAFGKSIKWHIAQKDNAGYRRLSLCGITIRNKHRDIYVSQVEERMVCSRCVSTAKEQGLCAEVGSNE